MLLLPNLFINRKIIQRVQRKLKKKSKNFWSVFIYVNYRVKTKDGTLTTFCERTDTMQEPNTNPMYVYADVVELILLRLPPKSLGRFKTVSKQWRSLLESNWFVELHLSFQKSGKTRRKILTARDCYCGAPQYSSITILKAKIMMKRSE